jgi:CheY-like chemotaxis protein
VGCTDILQLEPIAESDAILADREGSEGPPVILLVEDEDFVREVTCEVLRSAGFRVLKAREAIEATVAFRQHHEQVQLLITDVVMPGQNGRDLARELRAVCPGLKTLFVSGYPENANTREADEHAVFYLPKPFSAKSLVHAVKSILEQGIIADGSPAKRAAGIG